jgi:hypothetical protein
VYKADGNTKAIVEILKHLEVKGKDSDLYLPGNYTYISQELAQLPFNQKQVVGALPNCDYFVAKDYLWKILCNVYGISKASKLMPVTYILNSDSDFKRFQKEQTNNTSKIFIAKKNIQRQEGLKLLKHSDIINFQDIAKDEFVLLQEFVDNPYLISNRKLNIRVYALIINKKHRQYAFIYGDGFMYYTQKDYKYSTDISETITTGYIKPRTFYDDNPLTQNDLRKFLGPEKSLKLFGNIKKNLKRVVCAIFKNIKCSSGRNLEFQLFGCDYQINHDLTVYLLEINKGMSLKEMDKRDSEIKYSLQKDTMKLIGALNEDNNGHNFEQII